MRISRIGQLFPNQEANGTIDLAALFKRIPAVFSLSGYAGTPSEVKLWSCGHACGAYVVSLSPKGCCACVGRADKCRICRVRERL